MGFDIYYILEKIFQHLYIFIISWGMAIVVGSLISIFITREKHKKIGTKILILTGTLQAVPSIAIIAIIFLFVGIGIVPAIISLFLYSLVPIIFNNTSALLNVDKNYIEIAKGMGMNKKEILLKIEIPLSMSSFFSGIKNAAVIDIATATVASAIGGGGLGEIIYIGISNFDNESIILGSLLVSLLAIFVNESIEIVERKVIKYKEY
ncbi:ABC transporter permease [Haliovirga abyssi]|uniref:Choline ABC transporter permease n=1 Tax=Haliovirga abyssi TaxID=2996794 RepID=A0AAU9DC39_9FUSO|nr:ABC transporter permease [Haliovirga abyssi]BDU49703.1 choline ABC transporter permease [Haliovirga abyssi]